MSNPRTSLRFFRETLLATLGVAPLVFACSSSDNSSAPAASTGGSGGQADASVPGSGGAGGGASGASGAPQGGQAGGGAAGAAGMSGSGNGGGGGGGNIDGGSSICKNPMPHLGIDGKPTGFIDCDGGFSHRVEKKTCASKIPRATVCSNGAPLDDAGLHSGGCSKDSDCTAQPNGHCDLSSGPLAQSCQCIYGCTTDADCGPGAICGCADPVGQCLTAQGCAVDDDCGAGFLCMSSEDGSCHVTFGCQSPNDTCVTNADCSTEAGTAWCSFVTSADGGNGHHECTPMRICGTGRPFLVRGDARVASLVLGKEWCSDLSPAVTALDEAARARCATRWTDIALMEHASIAAFARFSLDLLAFGAPPELVALAQSAMADETVHARDAFALASAYAGRPLAPGALDVAHALDRGSLLDVVRTAIIEGCIGETVAAVEATEALAHATDPAVRSALARVAVDEARHAELAFKFVRFVLETSSPELALGAAAEIRGAVAAYLASQSSGAAVDDDEPSCLAHGVLSEGARQRLSRRVLAEVVEPCLSALLAAAYGDAATTARLRTPCFAA